MALTGQNWTDAELNASVIAYLEMLKHQSAGESYSKADYRRKLMVGPLANRTESSIEYRMQNISATMEELCLPMVIGYAPAKNVGTKVKDQIKNYIERAGFIHSHEYEPEDNEKELTHKTEALLQRRLVGKPRGQVSPTRSSTTALSFKRDPLVRAFVLQQASGVCENCRLLAPFQSSSGTPYLEVHHVKHLAEGGSDRVENAVALCPNCHRSLHLAGNREQVKEQLLKSIARLIPE